MDGFGIVLAINNEWMLQDLELTFFHVFVVVVSTTVTSSFLLLFISVLGSQPKSDSYMNKIYKLLSQQKFVNLVHILDAASGIDTFVSETKNP